jgi:hypothetical protein
MTARAHSLIPAAALAAAAVGASAALAQGPAPDRSAAKPAIFVNAPPERVHQAIIESARRRGADSVSILRDGVIIERPARFTSGYLADQCGQHHPDRVFVIRFVTAALRGGTAVTEDRYFRDPGRRPCRFKMSPEALAERNDDLSGLKRTVEAGPGAVFGGSPTWFGR